MEEYGNNGTNNVDRQDVRSGQETVCWSGLMRE